MANIIKYLHCDLFMVHRDLHHGNWMQLEDGSLKLIDFGLAHQLGPNGISADSMVFPMFASREVVLHQPCGFDVDVWYFGIIMYMTLKKDHPWDLDMFTYYDLLVAKAPHKKLEGEDARFNHLLDRCFDYNRDTRATITEIV